MLTSQNYKGTASEFSVLSIGNPIGTQYPVSKGVEPLLPKTKIENCPCSDEYMNFEYLAVNIYELTWIKYHPKHPISNYIKNYVPVYTKMHYENRGLKIKKGQ